MTKALFTVPVRLSLRALPLLEMTDKERRLVGFILAQGRKGWWTNYQGNNVGQTLAVQMDWDERLAQRAVAALKRRGWLHGSTEDAHGRQVLTLTPEFWRLCLRELERQKVRSALGWKLCHFYAIDGPKTDTIIEVASHMAEPSRYADKVKQAAATLYAKKPPPSVFHRKPRRKVTEIPARRNTSV